LTKVYFVAGKADAGAAARAASAIKAIILDMAPSTIRLAMIRETAVGSVPKV
jgi:hypothetical protein